MAESLRNVIVGAIVTVVATSTVGIVLTQGTRGVLQDTPWEGEWKTVSCFPNDLKLMWTVSFEQNGEIVNGTYRGGLLGPSRGAYGTINGVVQGAGFTGEWNQTSNKGVDGGPIKLQLDPSRLSFVGNYENHNPRRHEKAVWIGRRDEAFPTCPGS
jgi:hypothetical protein